MSTSFRLGIHVIFFTAFLVCAVCKELQYNNSNTANSSVNLESVKNETIPVVRIPDIQLESTQSRPETEEDLVAEMEELFKAMQLLGYDFERSRNSSQPPESTSGTEVTARMKMSDMFHPVMLVPQLIMWGFAPIILANLKMFVMQSLMMNKMALNAAIFMTLRNIVFGPRPGPVVKYVNHGYHHQPHHGPHHHHHRRRS